MSILRNLVNKNEMELFSRKKTKFMKSHREASQISNKSSPKKSTMRKTFSPLRNSTVNPNKVLDKFRYLEFIKNKLDLCDEIYSLLKTICHNNKENQEHLFLLIPNFQIHAKFLPSACQCISEIVGSNQLILNRITRTIKFNFDINELILDQKEQKFNILINIIDNNQDKNKKKVDVGLIKQDKLTNKPINLLNFFMNLIWEPKTNIKEEYLKFLRRLSRFKDKGININQEMIFKLYNCMLISKKENLLLNARVFF